MSDGPGDLPLRPLLRDGLPSSLRGQGLGHVRELHGRLPLADLDEIGHANVEHLGEVEEHLDARVPDPALDLLEVPVGEALGGDVLLRKPLPPASTPQVPARSGQEGREVHALTMTVGRTIIEPIRLAS